MNRISQRSLAVIAVVSLASVVWVTQAQTANGVQGWLDRMNIAVEELNYRGSYVHVSDGEAELFTITHRFADGNVRERITTSGDDAREILRGNDSVLTVIPERRRVIVEELEDAALPQAGALLFTDALRNLYASATSERGEVAGRATQYVNIQPRDGYRYGYRLWLDLETALLLRSQLVNEEGQVVEEMMYMAIEIVDEIPESEVVPAVGTDGFDWVRRITTAEPESESDVSSSELWAATRLPDGFRLLASQKSLLAGSTYPVQHLVYTDGLASVSVFIADPRSEANEDIRTGLFRKGGVSMYSVEKDGRLARAVGEVPPMTVQLIATSLDAD